MEKYELMFIVLTYRNSEDLQDFFQSCKSIKCKYKVVVVDAFYSEEYSSKIENISSKNDAVYLKIENKGYSFGNNYGINYAKKHFIFDYIIVSNPDIEINTFPIKSLKQLPVGCYGPEIITKDNRKQNPMYYRKGKLSRKLVYYGLKKDIKYLFYAGIILNKISAKISSISLLWSHQVYQLHGSFIIFHRDIVLNDDTLFDESMFLFAEETYLAFKFEKLHIKSFFVPQIKVKHKEDGSMKFRNDINEQVKTSNIYVYEHYYKRGR